MCNHCEPQGWSRICCNFCGVGVPAWSSISISVPHGEEFPYSTTDMCRKCFDAYNIKAALEHNSQCCEDMGVSADSGSA